MPLNRAPHRRSSNVRAGGWLVTYADLMTILVCFFVLIVSFSIQDQVKMEVVAGSMRDAFGVAEDRRYAGDFRLDGTPEERQPGNIIKTPTPSANGIDESLSNQPAAGANGRDGGFDKSDAAKRQFAAVRERLQQAIDRSPILVNGAEAVTITQRPEGLQVVIAETDGLAMFESGAREPTPQAGALLEDLARALTPFANRIFIEAHADAVGAGAYSAFDLTADRANAARRIMNAAGFPPSRIAGVNARGDADPLYPEDPFAAGNRRIEILLEPAAPLLPDEEIF